MLFTPAGKLVIPVAESLATGEMNIVGLTERYPTADVYINSKEVRVQKRKREATPSKKIKTGISGCGSFVVAYFQPVTSIDSLHLGCNRVHLHTVFVLLYSVCHFVSIISFFFFCVWERTIMSFICNNSSMCYLFRHH